MSSSSGAKDLDETAIQTKLDFRRFFAKAQNDGKGALPIRRAEALCSSETILPSPTAPPSFTQGRLESDGRGVPRRVSSDTRKNEIQRCWNKSTSGGRNRRAMKSCYAGLLEDSSPRLRMTVKGRYKAKP